MNRIWFILCFLCIPWIARGQSEYEWNCWFDYDINSRQTLSYTGEAVQLDVSELADGFHTVFCQADFGSGLVSAVVSRNFLKVPQTEGVDYLTCLFYIDGEFYQKENISSKGGILSKTLDVGQLSQGLHQLEVQVVTPGGAATGTYNCHFIRALMKRELDEMQCVYSVDGGEFKTEAGQMANGAFHCDLNVAELEDGLHRIVYMLSDRQGTQTKLQTQFFIKRPIGGEGLATYEYWVNENINNRTKVALDKHVDTYQLISLLPVESQPVRSKMFQFEVEDGQPVVYAKNEIHIRFLDTSEHFADANAQYVDYQQKQIVSGIIPITRDSCVTIEVPQKDEMRWFSFEASPGDTVAFKASQATSLQVFSPKGEEVYSASGSESVAYGGCHTWEKGTYYVALHDVTGSKPDITLDFFRLDKYDVVDWDVHTVGNGGCSTITFKGNGFRDLYAVDLYNAQGDTIQAKAIGFQDDAIVSITFDFTDVSTGIYDAVFHFTTESKKFKNTVTVEEAKDIKLALDVKYPSTFLRGTSTTYTITVTNKGNSTAYDVPMEIYLSAGGSFANISSVRFKDENGKTFNNLTMSEVEKDSIDDETIDYIQGLLRELDGLQTFIVINDSTGGGEYGFTDMLITIPPNCSMTFYMEINSSSAVKLNIRIPSEWITVHSDWDIAGVRAVRRNASDSNLCCEKEKWECGVRMAADVIGTLTSFSGNPIISSLGCISDIVDLATFTVFEIVCADGGAFKDKFDSFRKNVDKRKSAISKTINTIISCATFGVGRLIAGKQKELKSAKSSFDSAWDSMRSYEKQANDAFNRRDIALQKANEAQLACDFDLCGSYLKEADNAEKVANMYKEWAESAYNKAMEFNEQIVKLRQETNGLKVLIENIVNAAKSGLSALGNSECVQAWRHSKANCPPKPDDGGGSSNPLPPSDPNDIYGYLSDAGSKYIADHVEKVNYTIEFENDPTFAEASAHTIVIKDTLDSRYFDLKSFLPTTIKLGSRETYLNETDVTTQNGVTSFVKTIDMRPEINAIAQVEGTYSQNTGIAEWRFTSLDPMSLEPTDDLMQGILPVNYDGTSGIGEVMFEIGVKPNKADGTEISNRAGIVFDYEAPILTPTWTNIVDATTPVSHITNVEQVNGGETATVSIEATDDGSGPWRYNVYVQYGSGAWFLAAENVPADTTATVKLYEDMEHHFYCVATDMAGNVEQKEPGREFSLAVGKIMVSGDVNGDGKVDVSDYIGVANHILGQTQAGFNEKAADVNEDGKIDVSDYIGIANIILTSSVYGK